ncbi:MAG: hypothetical protein IKU01_10565 [Bacteroidales bacterium]|nr:hypothetical protein [Bacteroidales bacterium]
MKKTFTILFALMVLCFTQCKPKQEENSDNGEGKKVRISCSIPINNENRSDFTDLFEDGVINWSDGRECVYLAIPGDEPKIVELEGYCDGYKPTIEFIAYVDEHLLTAGQSYDIWYFGHSQQLDEPYVSLVDGNKIEGSISKQTGRLKDLGYSHIASTTVTAVMENGEVKLPLVGKLKNRMAIALVDLYTVTELKGTAVNTDYALEYNSETGKYEFNIVEDANAAIEIENALSGISYLALLPNENNKIVLEGVQYGFNVKYTFYNGIMENKIYHKIDTDGKMTNLTWQDDYSRYQSVDLGLPSGLKWAACNVGATSPEEYGNYYAWGETTTKSNYSNSNCPTYGLAYSQLQSQGYIDSEGNLTAQHDAATANWGSDWRMPTTKELKELINNCTWTLTTQNGVVGYKVTGPNGNSIFLPRAGGSGPSVSSGYGFYWSSTPSSIPSTATIESELLYYSSSNNTIKTTVKPRYNGLRVRPVLK